MNKKYSMLAEVISQQALSIKAIQNELDLTDEEHNVFDTAFDDMWEIRDRLYTLSGVKEAE